MNNQEKGNSLLELILYIPVAALILFSSTDIGLRWSESSALSSSLRSSMREAKLVLYQNKQRNIDLSALDEEIASEVGSRVYNSILRQMQSFRERSVGREQAEFSLIVQVIRVEVEPNTGEANLSTMRVVSEQGEVSLSNWQEYVGKQLSRSSSKFSQPRVSLSSDKGFANSFGESSYFVYSRVRSSSASLSRAFIYSVFGKQSTVEDEFAFSLSELK